MILDLQITPVPKKIDPLKWRQNTRKNEDDLVETWKFGTSSITIKCVFLHRNDFQILIILADMAFWMSNYGDFDNGQIPWKFAQR